MSLKKYITESDRAQSFMIEGDVFTAIVNEELALEFDVASHSDDSVVIEADDYALAVLESCGCTMDDDDISEDAKEKFEPHIMYDPKTGEGKKANVEQDHLDMKAKGWSHDKPKVKESVEVTTNYSDQATFHARMGNKDTAAYYMKKHHAALAESFKLVEDADDVADAIKRRLMSMAGFSDLVRQHGIDRIIDAVEQEAEFNNDVEELGSSDVSAMVNNVIRSLENVNEDKKRWKQTSMSPEAAIEKYGKENVKVKKGALRNGDDMVEILSEAEYQGRKVKLGKPTKGDVKKFKVYVKDPKTGNVKKVNFGDPNMEIRRDNPAAKKSFRARHNCSDKKDRTKAGYWSCRMWSSKPVSKIV